MNIEQSGTSSSARGRPAKPPALVAITPHRTGERTLLGVENLLQSIAVPEPFSLELAGPTPTACLLARCQDDRVVKAATGRPLPPGPRPRGGPRGRPHAPPPGELAWGLTLRAQGPEYVPLRTFRDDDLLDPGSDPLLAVIGALSALRPGERIVVSRLLLRSLGPEWSQVPPGPRPQAGRPRQPGAVLHLPDQAPATGRGDHGRAGRGALAAFRGYLWVQDGEILKASLLGRAPSSAGGGRLGLVALEEGPQPGLRPAADPGEGLPHRLRRRNPGHRLPARRGRRTERAGDLLESVAAAYRHYDHPAGARFRVGQPRPVFVSGNLHPPSLHPAGPGLFGGRSVLGVREAAALWHPPGEGDETPLVERSGSRALAPQPRGVRTGAPVGDATGGAPREVNFSDDLLRRHHLYVARTRMGKSTLMHHVVGPQAAGEGRRKGRRRHHRHGPPRRPGGRPAGAGAGVPHRPGAAHRPGRRPRALPASTCWTPASSPTATAPPTRWSGWPGACGTSGVRGCSPSWSTPSRPSTRPTSAGPRTEQYTILDGMRLLSDGKFRAEVLGPRSGDTYLLDWWVRDFDSWHRQYRSEAIAPVQTRLAYYASSKKARSILGQSRSTIDIRQTILDGGVLLVSTAQGSVRAATWPPWWGRRCSTWWTR